MSKVDGKIYEDILENQFFVFLAEDKSRKSRFEGAAKKYFSSAAGDHPDDTSWPKRSNSRRTESDRHEQQLREISVSVSSRNFPITSSPSGPDTTNFPNRSESRTLFAVPHQQQPSKTFANLTARQRFSFCTEFHFFFHLRQVLKKYANVNFQRHWRHSITLAAFKKFFKNEFFWRNLDQFTPNLLISDAAERERERESPTLWRLSGFWTKVITILKKKRTRGNLTVNFHL